jgi:hypothetical protein
LIKHRDSIHFAVRLSLQIMGAIRNACLDAEIAPACSTAHGDPHLFLE